ncbi:hypothetical protein [Niallia sp. 03190]|uniref:hypothetical protein n=1 Tax=Niallia sp. 03190 TaxID=3458061 RepID=UPI00404489F1
MKKSYSEFNILQNKLTGAHREKGLLQHFFSARKYLTIKLPYYSYLRGLIFIDDLKDNYPEEVPFTFDTGHLLHMLYSDFMSQVKRGVKNEEVGAYLKESMAKYFPVKTVEKRVFKKLSNTLFQFEEVAELEEEVEDEEERTAYLDIRMRDKIILRGEVLIHDLAPFLDGVSITVEQLISIIYLDFIKTVQDNGNSSAIQGAIVSSIKKRD